MSTTGNNSAVADWHTYLDGVGREDFPDQPDDHFGPKAGYVYQHDASNDEYHSILSSHEAARLPRSWRISLRQKSRRATRSPWDLKCVTD